MELEEDMLFNIISDPAESKNVKGFNQGVYKTLMEEVDKYDGIKSSFTVPPFGQGRKTFKAPKNWEIKE